MFKPLHIHAEPDDFKGNEGLGRVMLLVGSPSRAQRIADYFQSVTVKKHPRQHHLYLGQLEFDQQKIDIGVISTGMGCPSTDIILNELIALQARFFLRLGTCGSLQPGYVQVGDMVCVTAAVRDEATSRNYIYPEFPALASIDWVLAARLAKGSFDTTIRLYEGIVHTKDSLYAREFNHSFLPENKQYMQMLEKAGVLVSEMECAQIFILSALKKLFAGALLLVIGDQVPFSASQQIIAAGEERMILLGFETVYQFLQQQRMSHVC